MKCKIPKIGFECISLFIFKRIFQNIEQSFNFCQYNETIFQNGDLI